MVVVSGNSPKPNEAAQSNQQRARRDVKRGLSAVYGKLEGTVYHFPTSLSVLSYEAFCSFSWDSKRMAD